MANFAPAEILLHRWEGGYSNHKSDTGGETIFGISRVNWPELPIWRRVDKLKSEGLDKKNIELACKQDSEFMACVRKFYVLNFWTPIKGEQIQNQTFAENLFLLAVNAGVKRAVKVGQQACGVNADGILGHQTLNAFVNATDVESKKFTECEIKFYESLVLKNPSQSVFLKGWLNRAKAV